MPGRPPIILLEDDTTLRQVIVEGLRDHQFDVIEVAEVGGASEAIDACGGRAILVADRSIGRSVPNGFEMAARALEQYPQLKVIYVSGTHVAIRQRKMSERERSLLKPFAFSQLLLAIKQLQ